MANCDKDFGWRMAELGDDWDDQTVLDSYEYYMSQGAGEKMNKGIFYVSKFIFESHRKSCSTFWYGNYDRAGNIINSFIQKGKPIGGIYGVKERR